MLVSGSIATKASRQVDPAEPIELSGPPPRFVSRGGEKLDAALERFGVEVDGMRCLDAGASTGGFTDCLLQRGAAEVVAVDVGFGQLHERLRAHPRVRNLERTNIRTVAPADIGGAVPITVGDLSFISLRTVLPAVLPMVGPRGHLVLLVKPQFEAGRTEAARGKGVITDPAVWARVLGEVAAALLDGGAAIMGAMASPLRGADGNVEFLLHAQVASPQPDAVDLAALVALAVSEAEGR